MNYNKYNQNILNYNVIAKKNYYSINVIDKIILKENNKYITSPYNLLLILLSIKLLYNKKSFVCKSRKSNVFTGIRKNDNLGVKFLVTKNNMNKLWTQLLFSYNSKIDLTRNLFINKKCTYFTFNLKNIDKIDANLIKEYKLFKSLNYLLSFKYKSNYNKKLNDNLNIYLLLTHLGFYFTYYEK